MRIERLDRHFGVKLSAGVGCGAGILINVNSSGEGVLANDTGSIYAHGVALTSGSGTKTAGISQYVTLYRNAQVTDFGSTTFTPGETVYMANGGLMTGTAPGTINQKIGFALNSTTVFVDLDSSNLPA